jgi:hypothetical protein
MAGAPRYIPKLSTITDNPRPRTSDSDSALEILKKDMLVEKFLKMNLIK